MVELLAGDEEKQARSVFVLLAVVDVAGPREQLQGADGGHGEVVEHAAEAFELKLVGAPFALALGHLQEGGDVFVNAPHIVARGKGFGHAAHEFAVVGLVVEEHGEGGVPVAPRAPRLLEVGFE